MADHIEYGKDGQARSFTGEGAVAVFAMAVMASGLRLYARTGMKPNRAYTPTAMMKAARAMLDSIGVSSKGIGAREYLKMADILSVYVQEEKARIAAEQQ